MGSRASHNFTQTKKPTTIKTTTGNKYAWVRKAETRATQTKSQDTEKKFVDDALKLHNELRAAHGSPPLGYSKALAAQAQTWANTLASKSMLMHSDCRLSDGSVIGENVYMGWSVDGTVNIKAKDAVNTWYNEIKLYDFSHQATSSFKTGHFTQLIWKSTTHMGIARAKSEEGGVYVVANYSPPGNIPGEFEHNVEPVPSNEDIEDENDFDFTYSSDEDYNL